MRDGVGGGGMVDGFLRDVAILYEKHTIRMIAPEVQALHAKVCNISDKLSQASLKKSQEKTLEIIGRFQRDELNKLIREVEIMQVMVSMSSRDIDES